MLLLRSTVAEEAVARKIAFWHGAALAYIKPGGEWMTTAKIYGCDRPETYAERHWKDYMQAAQAILEDR